MPPPWHIKDLRKGHKQGADTLTGRSPPSLPHTSNSVSPPLSELKLMLPGRQSPTKCRKPPLFSHSARYTARQLLPGLQPAFQRATRLPAVRVTIPPVAPQPILEHRRQAVLPGDEARQEELGYITRAWMALCLGLELHSSSNGLSTSSIHRKTYGSTCRE
eukprot:CAMPEP_0117687124 /NCGR_PEP_ID=MMETSP0804-20121206/22938_1 /TAXON_ID=1074897 /ORGANISM="Tetraselmis astigmatica, Strain CCMP880" /LENGTH=160 /DNA_ID=CAMNT_0005499107 /DNA_START=203 /DNA_END=686 /DNA_ORIENTATION=+